MKAKKLVAFAPLWVFVATFAVLVIHPVPECFNCEFPNPWGRDDAAYRVAVNILDAWLVGASAVAGFVSIRRNWLVPVAIMLADLLTQHVGGVPLWSLTQNEGPIIVIAFVVLGTGSLAAGWIVRRGVDYFRPNVIAQNT